MTVKNVVIGQNISSDKVLRAKELRREMTPAEAVLWEQLCRNKLGGFHFRRQQVIDGFIVDFYCHECALVIEIDGDIHDLQREHDVDREAHLRSRGFQVIRFSNQGVLNHLDMVKNRILETCISLRHPLPGSGRGSRG
jgi:very-short-patch-repair endonuclease